MIALLRGLFFALRWLVTAGTAGLGAWGVALVGAALTAILAVGQDLFIWLFDELLGVVVLALNAIEIPDDIPTLQSLVDELANLGGSSFGPNGEIAVNIGQGLIWVWRNAGLADGLAIVAAAVGVKLFLKLIPLVRL